MNDDIRRPERPWATGVLVVSGAISLSFNVRHSLHFTKLPAPLALLYGAGPIVLAAMQSHVVALQAARGELVGKRRKAFTFSLVIGALGLSFLGIFDLLQRTVPNPFPHAPFNAPAILTPIVIDLMALAALHELLRVPGGAQTSAPVATPAGRVVDPATIEWPRVANRGPTPVVARGVQTGGAHSPGEVVATPVGQGPDGSVGHPVVATPAAAGETASADTASASDSNSGAVDLFTARGETQTRMRAYWDTQIAAGVIPSGGDLNRAVDKDTRYSLGKKYAKQWRAALPAAFVAAADAGDTEAAMVIAASFPADERGEAAG